MVNKTTHVVKIPRIHYTTLLSVIFIVLKLTGAVNWAWWAVTIPLNVSGGVFLLGMVIGYGYFKFENWMKQWIRSRR